jgi:hypothetical protein
MNFIKTRAAIAAIQALLASHEGSKAVAAYDLALAQSNASSNENTAGNESSGTNRSSIPDFVLQTMFKRMDLAAEALHSALLNEEEYIDQVIHAAGFFSQLNIWFRQIRRLNGGKLASDELYALEAETNALVLKTK